MNLGVRVDIKKVPKRRSLPQNRYLHLLLSAWGAHFGYTTEESKEVYKQLNKDIYRYEKNGHVFWKSSAELTTEQMMRTIDKFRDWSAEHDYPLPTATDQGWLEALENSVESMQQYL
jgi:hypothetical protein